MRKIKDVLRLKLDARLSHEQIAAALGISKGVVTKYVGLAATAGLDWPTVQIHDEVALERLLLVAPEKPRNHVQPDYGRIHQELRRKGMTLMLLWEEYRADHADGQTYSYSQFCDKLPALRPAAQARRKSPFTAVKRLPDEAEGRLNHGAPHAAFHHDFRPWPAHANAHWHADRARWLHPCAAHRNTR